MKIRVSLRYFVNNDCGSILDPLWFLLELSLELVMLGPIFLLTDHSDAFDAYASASDILPVSSSEIAGISSFSSSSSPFFKLLLVSFLKFRKLLSRLRKL